MARAKCFDSNADIPLASVIPSSFCIKSRNSISLTEIIKSNPGARKLLRQSELIAH
jgi:hypothetical protein